MQEAAAREVWIQAVAAGGGGGEGARQVARLLLCSSEGNAMQAKSWATNVNWTILHFTTGLLEDGKGRCQRDLQILPVYLTFTQIAFKD